MALRVCNVPGCPRLQPEPRCAEHTTNLYGPQHQAERRRWAPHVAAGKVRCWRCGHPIRRGQRWDLGHDDDDPSVYRGPEHVACNRATEGR